jgi:hypothetical protein
MSEEYQRLQEAASAVEREIRELEQNHSISSAAELRLRRHCRPLPLPRTGTTRPVSEFRHLMSMAILSSQRTSAVWSVATPMIRWPVHSRSQSWIMAQAGRI